MRKMICLLGLLASCVPISPEGVVAVQVGISGAMERRQVNHFTLRLYGADRSLKGTYRSFQAHALLQHVPHGTYFVSANAYASWDDSVSLAQAGAVHSSNWVVVDHQGVRYSEGQALQASLPLRSLVAVIAVQEGSFRPISVSPH